MSDQSQAGMLGVKTGELGRLSTDMTASGQAVRNRVKDVSDNTFGPGDAGANYADQGKKIQHGLDTIANWLAAWSEATLATADVVGASVVKYSNTDSENSFHIAKIDHNAAKS
ncbi:MULTISPECIES: hypothetical protein [unclassified Nocardia]|uniref:hypothetical protein n=1 Tax=unclassified Nocardia TaxID=2637762 RepID=UPI001CE3FB5F|nr:MULTISPECIES: hypothetical protein [unclassified Nocardia]